MNFPHIFHKEGQLKKLSMDTCFEFTHLSGSQKFDRN